MDGLSFANKWAITLTVGIFTEEEDIRHRFYGAIDKLKIFYFECDDCRDVTFPIQASYWIGTVLHDFRDKTKSSCVNAGPLGLKIKCSKP